MPRWTRLLAIMTIAVAGLGTAPGAEEIDLGIVSKWLAKQSGAKSLQIDFTQTRRLKALKNPIQGKGRMWLDFTTRRFRWQDGDPPKTIVVNDGEQLVIAQPKRKRVEFRPRNGKGSSGPASLAALAGGFPKTLAEFQKNYRTLSTNPDDEHYRVRTQPVRGEAAKGVAQLTFFIDRKDFVLRGYLAILKDGSSVQYDFQTIVPNPEFAGDTFKLATEGYEVVKPTR